MQVISIVDSLPPFRYIGKTTMADDQGFILLDTLYAVETPEGVELNLLPAGILARCLAYALDLLIRLALAFIVSFALGQLLWFGLGLSLIIYFLLEWFYPVYFECIHQGKTPGKKAFKLRVLKIDATPLSFSDSLIRNLLRAADFFPLFYLFGLTSMALTRHSQRLGDLAAATVVVYSDSIRAPVETDNTPALPCPLPLTTEARRAIVEFAERSAQLSSDRRQELAQLLQGLTQLQGEAAVRRLKQYAKDFGA